MRLFHFSDDSSIEVFVPRPVRVPSQREPGFEWLNGPLVWTVSEQRQVLYLFPRDCPRIVLWPTPNTTEQDLVRWWGSRGCQSIAHVEWSWLDRIATGTLYRYELPAESFEQLGDGSGWVSREVIEPLRVERLDDLLGELRTQEVELRVMETLAPLKDVWSTTLHASGIRLRNARSWPSE